MASSGQVIRVLGRYSKLYTEFIGVKLAVRS